MKYFILYVSHSQDFTQELYVKTKSMEHLLMQIERYADGYLSTSKGSIHTINVASIFAREVEPSQIPLKKNQFATINENKSYSTKDLE
ncbi:hypothetical protein [Mesobacillus stamsii]|uniref:DUF3906 family protein n=1 Tax=Mesobacillus stamsii TaxID=225347 RepID=A0ABU0G0F7_9BACI|nr:hypothetical protein [Mesobacillus stamsii]MDQ0415663.1 hypothetical protein [Mesobacillus stamsii]